jgi:acylphosphatase
MSKDQTSRLTAHVTGLVQGVNFRWFTQRRANELNVVGYVKNEPDGSVSFVAEGPRESLERLLDFARSGPSSAVVENVETEWGTPTGEFYRFEIRY